MHLHVSMRCSTPLCQGVYDSFHVFGMAKKHVFKKLYRRLRGGGGGRPHWNFAVVE